MTGPVVLVGAPGAGKSTVGALLARALRTTFTDTDDLVEEAAGKSVAEIFVDDGEPAFRVLEAESVDRALATDGVVALGGGAVMSTSVRKALAGQRVVWLEVGLAEAVRRTGLGVSRPVLLGNVRGQMADLLKTRNAVYEDVATQRVLTDGTEPATVADEVARAIEGDV